MDKVVIVRCKERGHYTLPDGVVVWADIGDIVHVTAEDAARLEAEGKVERYA